MKDAAEQLQRLKKERAAACKACEKQGEGQGGEKSDKLSTGKSGPNKGGSLRVNADGTVSYTPRKEFRGTETFRYNVRDMRGAVSNIATVNVKVR